MNSPSHDRGPEVRDPSSRVRVRLAEMNIRGKELARRTGLSQAYVSDVLNAKRRMSPRCALLIERETGLPAYSLLHDQMQADLAEARMLLSTDRTA